jgi:hypothetical protein
MLPDKFGQFIKVAKRFFLLLPIILGAALSHEREHVGWLEQH